MSGQKLKNSTNSVQVQLFRWAGSWGPFKVKIPCGECSLTLDVIRDTMANELSGIPVELEVRDWLSEWWKPLRRGGWHAPIVMVERRLVCQGHALNRGVLTEAIIDVHARRTGVRGNHVFGKSTCPHCHRARDYLDTAGIDYTYHDVVASPRSLYEMLARVKPIVGPKTPITVPQIWIETEYVGGADQLSKILDHSVIPNPERGRNSMSPNV